MRFIVRFESNCDRSPAAVKTVKVMTVFRRKTMRLSELARDNEAQRTLVGIGKRT